MDFKEVIKRQLLKGETKGENLVDLLSTAFYGSTWFTASVDKEKYGNLIKPSSEYREQIWADVLMGGGTLIVTETETEVDDEVEHEISLKDICKGITKLHDKHLNVYARVMAFDGSADFYDADAVIQFAVFGEWVFG